jgi:hypothetical protein
MSQQKQNCPRRRGVAKGLLYQPGQGVFQLFSISVFLSLRLGVPAR